jgi:hypothetical protein
MNDSDYISIEIQKDYIYLNWKRSPNDVELKAGLNKGLDMAIEANVHKWLANTKNIEILPALTNDWVNRDWFPRCLTQINKMAIIIPKSALAMMNVNQIMTRVGKLENKYFATEESALQWL